MEFRKQSDVVYKCEYHVVIVTKYRRDVFNEGSFSYFQEIMQGITLDMMPEVDLIENNHDKDHIHMLLSIPPKMRISDVVRTIKSTSGRLLKKRFEYMRKAYWGIDGIWSDGYFVSTVGLNESVIRNYIEMQGREDKGQAQLVLGHRPT